MASSSIGRVALMSLHPRHAEAILAGRKTVEFRRRPFGQPVTQVVIYATQPIGQVVGSFVVTDIDVASPAELWERHGDRGAISRPEFDGYFDGSITGAAIEVGHVSHLADHMPLSALAPGLRPPQSYLYLDSDFRFGRHTEDAPAERRSGNAALHASIRILRAAVRSMSRRLGELGSP